VYDNKTKIKVSMYKYKADNTIFDKIKKKRKLNKKIKAQRFLGKFTSSSINLNSKIIIDHVNNNINRSQNINKSKNMSVFTNLNFNNINSNEFETKDNNLSKINTKVIDRNRRDKFSQDSGLYNQDGSKTPNTNNYKSKAYNNYKGIVNNQNKTDQYNKFEKESSTYKSNNNDFRYKDKSN
jgi:hypothetical protein